MTEEEYKKELQRLNSQFELDKKALYKKFAFANNPYKIGDIIKDHIGFGLIDKIQFAGPSFGCLPQCVYLCLELKVDKTPKKSGMKRQIWKYNILES